MIAEETEFQISQYVDGTLPVAQRQAVDQLLQMDPHARKILADYQRLQVQLVNLNTGPSVHWNRLSEHLSDEIDRATATVVAGRIGRSFSPGWSPRLRIAAAMLVAGTAWIVMRHMNHHPLPVPLAPSSTIDVSGPRPEVAKGPPVEDVQVGPSQLAARNNSTRYGEGVIDHGPSKVVISSLPPAVKHDAPLH